MKHIIVIAIAAALSFLLGLPWISGALALIAIILTIVWALKTSFDLFNDAAGNDDGFETLDEILLNIIKPFYFYPMVLTALIIIITCIPAYFFLPTKALWVWLGYTFVSTGCLCFFYSSYPTAYSPDKNVTTGQKTLVYVAIIFILLTVLLHLLFRAMTKPLHNHFPKNDFINHLWDMQEDMYYFLFD